MKSKRVMIIVIVVLVLLLIFGAEEVLCTHRTDKESLIKDDNAIPWNGEQSLPRAARAQGNAIAIPGFDELVFIEKEKKQAVNFYNPESNDCLFLMTLLVNDKQVWKSGYVAPGNGERVFVVISNTDENGRILFTHDNGENTLKKNIVTSGDTDVGCFY